MIETPTYALAELIVTPHPQVERVGLGYRVIFPAAGVQLAVNRLRESRGELSGELTVRSLIENAGNVDGHIFEGRFGLSSLAGRRATAGFLADRERAVPWTEVLERFCIAVLTEHRKGQPVVLVGRLPRLPEPAMLLAPIVRKQGATVVFGPGGVGKSTLAAAIAVSLQTGVEIVPGWKPEQTNVAVLDWEASDEDWNEHIAGIAEGAGIEPPEIHYQIQTRPLADQVEEVSRLVTEKSIGVLLVDSVGLASGIAGDSADANESALRMFAALRQINKPSVLIDHITGADLQTQGPISKPYGGIYKVNSARAVFELKREKDIVGPRSELLLINTKVNRGRRLMPIGLGIEYTDGGAIRFTRGEVQAPELMGALPVSERMYRALREGAKFTEALGIEINASEATIRSALKRDKGHRYVRLQDGRIGLVSHA